MITKEQILAVVADGVRGGKLQVQVPCVCIDIDSSGALARMQGRATTDKQEIQSANVIRDLCKTGELYWNTNKGMIKGDYDTGPVNPATGRKISGFLWMSPELVDELIDDLWDLYSKAWAGETYNHWTGNSMTKSIFKEILIEEAKNDKGYVIEKKYGLDKMPARAISAQS